MRIVKLSELGKKEREKVLREQQERINKNNQERQRINQEVNNKFKEITQNNTNNNTSNTVTYNKIMESMKNSGASKEKISQFKKDNRLTLWDTIQDFVGNFTRTTHNLILGGEKKVLDSLNLSHSIAQNKLEPNEIRRGIRNVNSAKDVSLQDKLLYSANARGANSKINESNSNKQNEITTSVLRKKSDKILPIMKNDRFDKLINDMSSKTRLERLTGQKKTNQGVLLPNTGIMRTNYNYDNERIEKIARGNPTEDIIEDIERKQQENIEKQTTPFSRKLAELADPIGGMAVGSVISSINPVMGTAFFTTSAAGSYLRDAKARGMNENDAIAYAGLMGIMEGTTEELSFANFQKAGKVAKSLIEGTGKVASKEVINTTGKVAVRSILKNYGIGIGENVLQESIMEPISETVATITGGKETANWNDMGQRMLKAGIDGGLVSAIVGGAKIGLQSCTSVVKNMSLNKEVSKQDIQQAVKDASKKLDVEQMVVDSVKQQVDNYKATDGVQMRVNENQNTVDSIQSEISEQINDNTKNIVNDKEQVKIDSENFSKQVDNYIAGKMKSSDFINVGKTSPILQRIGLPNKDIILKQSKLKTIMQEGNNADSKLHGLSSDIVKRIPEALSNPLNVLQSSTDKNSVVVITDLADKMERPVIASIEMDYKGRIGNIDFLSNRLTSAYGKNNYDRFMEIEIAKGNLLYDIDEGIIKELPTSTRLQSSEGLNSFVDTVDKVSTSNNSISQKSINMQVPIQNNQQINQLENNQEMLYNSSKESESDINGYNSNEQRGIKDVYQQKNGREQEQGRDRIDSSTENSFMGSKNKNDAETHYREFEQKVRNRQITNISKESQQVRGFAKKIYNKDIIHYDDNEIRFSGGLSNLDDTSIFFGKNAVENYGDSFLLGHEIGEDMLKHHKEQVERTYKELQEKIQNDENFGNVYLDYIFDMDEELRNTYIEHPELIAKELICDTLGFMQNDNELGNNLPYKEITDNWVDKLDSDLVSEIKSKLKKHHDDIYINKTANPKINNINEMTREEIGSGKTRKHYKSIYESDQIGQRGKDVAKQLYKTDTYTPISNNVTMSKVNDVISKSEGGIDGAYFTFMNKLNDTSQRIRTEDIAMGERLIQIYSQNGDYEKVNNLIQSVSILGTESGQMTQAFSLIKKASPEGQLQYLQKVVDRMNKKNETNIEVTQEMTEKILKSKNQSELQDNISEVAENLANQLPISLSDKLRSWRYLSMLGNPRTHIRNLVANVFMNVVQNVKNKVSGGIQDVTAKTFYKDLEKTQTMKLANEDAVSFAKQDAIEMADFIDGGGKYDVKNIIENSKRSFDNKFLNWIAEFNSNALDKEDKIFLKFAYRQAMQEYMTARNLKSSDMTGSVLEKARQYASLQAQEATFHQASALANQLTEIENKGGVLGTLVKGVLPFKKTPINIAKEGIDYSPIGLVKSITSDMKQLHSEKARLKKQLDNGKITSKEYKSDLSNQVNKTIDDMAKGLTGTSIAVLGFALANMGVLKAGNSGDEDEFEEELGKQEYSIQFGDDTYSLDWVAPAGIPLFIGASFSALISNNGDSNGDVWSTINRLATSTANSLEPMTEMSMLSSLTNFMTSYSTDSSTGVLMDKVTSVLSSYGGQFVPTALSQVTKTIDPFKRSTSSTKSGVARTIDSFTRQQMAKIPILSSKLPVREDIWGNEQKREDNVFQRFAESSILPWSREKVNNDKISNELKDLYKRTGESGILPEKIQKSMTLDKEDYVFTSEEFSKYKKMYGQGSYKMLSDIINTSSYKNLSDEKKQDIVEKIYKYNKELIKKDYANANGQKYKESSMMKAISHIKNIKGNVSNYFIYKVITDDMEADEDKDGNTINGSLNAKKAYFIMNNMQFSTKDKNAFLKDLTKSDNYETVDSLEKLENKEEVYKYYFKLNQEGREKFQTATNIINNQREYIKFKEENFESDKKDDGTIKGQSISGSKKKKVYDYVNSRKDKCSYAERLYMFGTLYKLNNDEKNSLIKHIYSLDLTDDEKLNIVKSLEGSIEYKNGSVEYGNFRF